MPKLTDPDARHVYRAAEQVVDGPLRVGASLFTSRETLWRGDPVAEAHTRLVDGDRRRAEAFDEMLERVLDGSSDAAKLLVAEILCVHFLIARPDTIGGAKKREHVGRLLDAMDEPVAIPDQLADTLDTGLVSAGMGFNTHRAGMVRYLLEFVRAWDAATDDERDELLDDPWAFREFAFGLDTPKAQLQRHAFLHLVFPEIFEPILSESVKQTIVGEFSEHVDHPEGNVDRKLVDVRDALSAQIEGGFESFYDEDVKWRWESDAWDEFLEFVGRLYEWDGFEANEREYKREVAANLADARQAFLDADDAWPQALETAFGPPNNLASWRLKDALLTWVDDAPEDARVGFRILWAEDGTAAERIGGFLEVAPDDLADGPATRLSLASFLLMGVDATTYPYYRAAPFRDAYRLVDYPLPDHDRPVDAYNHALAFLDALMEDSARRSIEIEDRQDAQSLLWMVTGKDPTSLHFLDADLRDRLSTFLDENLPDESPGEARDGAEEDAAAEPVEVDELVDEVFVAEETFRELLDVLAHRKNLVLEGPAGVGKSHLARRLAWGLVGARDDGRLRTVQLHPSYGYGEFVQGFRPLADGGRERRDGIFVEFCRRAQTDTARPYVFVVDEMARGELGEVFGELTTLLEPGRRGPEHAMPLRHVEAGRETFWVPANVHVVGTMNAADRAEAMADGVLRRRFAFAPIEPAFGRESFEAFLAERGVPPTLRERITRRMRAINETIAEEIGPAFRIGHGYFCPPADALRECDEAWFRRIVEYDIRPLLRAYWDDDPGRAEREVEGLLE